MNKLHSLACLALVSGIVAAAPREVVAQPSQTCAQALAAKPNYANFVKGLDRVRATGVLSQSQPITIFALDNSVAEQAPRALRNGFRALGSEETMSPNAAAIIDQVVVEGVHRVADLKPGADLYTLNDAAVRVIGMNNGRPVLRIAGFDMVVITPDQPCTNGMIQGVTFLPRQR